MFDFQKTKPVMLAPLAGVSDHPFRRVCASMGADLTYVEMLSAVAINYRSKRTLEMMVRHPSESRLGVQVTGPSPEEVGRAVGYLSSLERFDTIDLNMGCPVKKVVKTGCGSAILKDVDRVRETTRAAVKESSVPVTAKIRIGWDRNQVNGVEVARAAQDGGAAWVCVHGRTRSDDYSVPVDLPEISRIKRAIDIPLIGNGNLFGYEDSEMMTQATACDGVMVSRGALGNPWVFAELTGRGRPVDLESWYKLVSQHLAYQSEAYGESGPGAVRMRKHMIWYLSGWPEAKKVRESVVHTSSISELQSLLGAFVDRLSREKILVRRRAHQGGERFSWDPKWQMDRRLDRGVDEKVYEDATYVST